MKYDKSKHYLRPLEPGEIIEADDVHLFGDAVWRPANQSRIGDRFSAVWDPAFFRPVPRTTGWRPRSEAAEVLDGLAEADLVAVCYENGVTVHGVRVAKDQTRWHAFFIIPPCDIPPPDPERERFEKWHRNEFPGCSLEKDLQGNYVQSQSAQDSWMVWQAAARKEAV